MLNTWMLCHWAWLTLLGAPALVFLVYQGLASTLLRLADQIRRTEEGYVEPAPSPVAPGPARSADPRADPLDAHAELRARVKRLNATSVTNYRIKSGELP
ncbi:hypothetical protein [Streptomyces sp. NBRC 109706]|uniref:hypothetical protein n=1 Tax=Streptomyces sp. NBRC 109706 TaxID=1550035 RepID=UPI0007861392|nr:hypothetical protein [Streptomyces sp. NBRC 109706]